MADAFEPPDEPRTHEDRSRRRAIVVTIVALHIAALVGYLVVTAIGS